MKNSLIFFVWLFSSTEAIGQQKDSISNINFYTLPFNKQVGYTDENGEKIGCGWSLECLYSELTVTRATLNKPLRRLEIEGYYYFREFKSQPFDYEILLGQPINDTLKNIKKICYYLSENSFNPIDSTPVSGNGHFHINFSFTEKDQLYFNGGSAMALREYDIGFLLRNKKD